MTSQMNSTKKKRVSIKAKRAELREGCEGHLQENSVINSRIANDNLTGRDPADIAPI